MEPWVRHRTGSFEVVRGLVAHGLGHSLLVARPASDMSYDGQGPETVALDRELPASRIVLARKESAQPSPVAGFFSRHCREFFRPAARDQ